MNEEMRRLYAAAAELCSIKGQSELARRLNLSPQVVKNWESRGISKAGLLAAQSEIGCRAEWIQHGSGSMRTGSSEAPTLSSPNLLALSQLRGRATPRSIAALDKIEQAAKQGRLKEADLILLEGIAARFEELNAQKS